jgi:hypothetical protein
MLLQCRMLFEAVLPYAQSLHCRPLLRIGSIISVGTVVNAVDALHAHNASTNMRKLFEFITQNNSSKRVQDEGDGGGGSLLADIGAPASGGDGDEIDGPDGVLAEAEAWAPTPIELDNARLHDPASFDIISTLIDIYGDSLFVAEYKCVPLSTCQAALRNYYIASGSASFTTTWLENAALRYAGECWAAD